MKECFDVRFKGYCVLFLLLMLTVVPEDCMAESCYTLGFKYGVCSYQSLKGLPCELSDDFEIPLHCRGVKETQQGIFAGVKQAEHDMQGKETGGLGSDSTRVSGQRPCSEESLATLRSKLKGGTVSKVIALCGKPNRKQKVMGHTAYVYGESYAESDVAIVFEKNMRVMTVTYY